MKNHCRILSKGGMWSELPFNNSSLSVMVPQVGKHESKTKQNSGLEAITSGCISKGNEMVI